MNKSSGTQQCLRQGGHDVHGVGIQILTYFVPVTVSALTDPACDYGNSCDLTRSWSLVIGQRCKPGDVASRPLAPATS